MSKTLYLECDSGISGDMFVAALIDLGADRDALKRALDSLNADGFHTKISRVKKSGLAVCDFEVRLDGDHENHDHDMEYLYGHQHHHDHDHDHHHGHDHHHHHRGIAEINAIIESADMTGGAKSLANRIFDILAQAEAKAHGVPVGEVHFHEVGAVDSIVDIVAAAVCFDSLDIGQVIIPHLTEGRGTVRCQHGILPVPVPAVANIVGAFGLPIEISQAKGELVTPTGAAIAAAIRTGGTLPTTFTVEGIGLGAGKRAYERPSILRAMIIRECGTDGDTVCKLETNIDDATGEELGHVMEKLLEAGAKDVFFTPVYMKKNRPGTVLSVICGAADVPALESIIFSETTTIGIRRFKADRTVLRRSSRTVATSLGEVSVKFCTLPDGSERAYPEYESIKRLAEQCGKPLYEVKNAVLKEV